MRIVFFGTPAFAVPSLHALLGAGHAVAGVVTQPDRSHGRSRSVVVAPPVKLAALEAGIPVLQPEKPIGPGFIEQLAACDADLGVVVAYGHILRPQVLATPRLGMVNVHASLLPRWRGAAPIQWAIKSGDLITGVTIMQMEAGLDSGPAWLARSIPIGAGDTGGSLTGRLSVLGADALLEALPQFGSAVQPTPQDGQAATFAPKIDRAVARIAWNEPARSVTQHVAAFDPAPGAWTTLGEADLKLFGAETSHGSRGETPGVVLQAGDVLEVATGDGTISLREVQPAGKKRQPVAEWVRGRGIAAGARFT